MLQRLQDNHLFAKWETCQFAHTTIVFPGYYISPAGVEINPEEVESLQVRQPPWRMKDMAGAATTGVRELLLHGYSLLRYTDCSLSNVLKGKSSTGGLKSEEPSMP